MGEPFGWASDVAKPNEKGDVECWLKSSPVVRSPDSTAKGDRAKLLTPTVGPPILYPSAVASAYFTLYLINALPSKTMYFQLVSPRIANFLP